MTSRLLAAAVLVVSVAFAAPARAFMDLEYDGDAPDTTPDLHYVGVGLDYPAGAAFRLLAKGPLGITQLNVPTTGLRKSLDGTSAYSVVDLAQTFRLFSVKHDHQLGLGVNLGLYGIPLPGATETSVLKGAALIGLHLGYAWHGLRNANLMGFLSVSGVSLAGEGGAPPEKGTRTALDVLGTYVVNDWLNAFGEISLARYSFPTRSFVQPQIVAGAGYSW
jgi:hypothetical protein